MNIVGFILSRNNGNLIEKAIKKCPQCINQIFISDDKSTDKTHEVAKKNGIEIFTNEKINGYGGNVKNALKVAFKMMLIMLLKFMGMVLNFIQMQHIMHCAN